MEVWHEILTEVKEIAVAQAALKEKVEAHLYKNKRVEEDIAELKINIPKIERHDVFMKISVWVYIFIISTIGVRLFSGKLPI